MREKTEQTGEENLLTSDNERTWGQACWGPECLSISEEEGSRTGEKVGRRCTCWPVWGRSLREVRVGAAVPPEQPGHRSSSLSATRQDVGMPLRCAEPGGSGGDGRKACHVSGVVLSKFRALHILREEKTGVFLRSRNGKLLTFFPCSDSLLRWLSQS